MISEAAKKTEPVDHPQARLAERGLPRGTLLVTPGWICVVATCCRVIGAPASFGAGRSCRPGARPASAARAGAAPSLSAAAHDPDDNMCVRVLEQRSERLERSVRAMESDVLRAKKRLDQAKRMNLARRSARGAVKGHVQRASTQMRELNTVRILLLRTTITMRCCCCLVV